MKSKIFTLTIFILILLVFSSSSYAEDSLENGTALSIADDMEVIEDVQQDELNINEEDSDNLEASYEISVTDDNYDQYFNGYTGKFKNTVDVSKINTLKIGNVSNKLFDIDIPLNIKPLTPDSQIRNGIIHLTAGSDGSNITNIVINNTEGDLKFEGMFISRLHGIWLSHTNNNFIFNNTILIPYEEGCYAMPMGYSSYNRIFNNTIKSALTSCFLMGDCNYNNISYNYVEIYGFKALVTSNIIYFNPFGHADYHGSGACKGTYISNNYFKGYCNEAESVILAIGYDGSDNTQVINNTIIRGAVGIYPLDPFFHYPVNNITITGNTIINSSIAISTTSWNVLIENNTCIGDEMTFGIAVEGIAEDSVIAHSNVTIANNYLDYYNLRRGIDISSGDSIVYNNVINIRNYGSGIYVHVPKSNANNCIVDSNVVNVWGDEGIVIRCSNTTVTNNVINTQNIGINIKNSDESILYLNNTILNNIIHSNLHAIYIEGYVYNTTVKYNEIESNETEPLYIYINEIEGYREWGNFSDNMINGVIENTETIIVNDDNFYDYFDSEGYLTYNFAPNSRKIIFLTHLSNKNIYFTDTVTLTSNKMANLLYDVTITFEDDASSSSISDFNFYNVDRKAIILSGVENATVKNNQFTIISNQIFDISAISVEDGCLNGNIIGNDIFINSKTVYAYAIYVSNPMAIFGGKFSQNFTISGNNILVKATGVGEGIYADSLVESTISNNHINIISKDSGYGISICNIMGRPYGITIYSNEIIINSEEMSYLIELFMVDSTNVKNNYLMGSSNGIYGIGVYNSLGISIDNNEIIVSGKELTNNYVDDLLGKGNAAIYVNRSSQIDSIAGNIIDIENAKILSNNSDIPTYKRNNYVISNYNRDLYFNNQNKLIEGIIKNDETILFKNFTSIEAVEINIPVNIKPYKHLNKFSGNLILSESANAINIEGFDFINATITLNNVNDIKIKNNTFESDKNIIKAVNGQNNVISNNIFAINSTNSNIIELENILGFVFSLNEVNMTGDNSNFISIKKSVSQINNNEFDVLGNLINVISSYSSQNNICNNDIVFNGDGEVYDANGESNDKILDNVITINLMSDSLNKAAIHFDDSSVNNEIKGNRIISSSDDGEDYAVIINTNVNSSNIVVYNYLISSNGYKKGNDAVYAVFELVCNNTPVIVYVSLNGDGVEDGSLEHPFSSITKAIESTLSGAIIYISSGHYNESNIQVDKNITLTTLNEGSEVYLDALGGRLFNITSSGILTVNGLNIFNGFSVEGGSLFLNNGILHINNSAIFNSSSYYDNSNPEFTPEKQVGLNLYSYSYDCDNLGLGGAILNYGELIIDSSDLYNNFGHKGGVLADYGKTTIRNSFIHNNSGVRGGAVFTDSNQVFTIENSTFYDNQAIQTLDYSYILRETIYSTYKYKYTPVSMIPIGHGGAIFSNTSLIISDSLFDNNKAKSGGAIAFYSDFNEYYNNDGPKYSHYYLFSTYVPTTSVIINNSTFSHNAAGNTSDGNTTMLLESRYDSLYSSNFNGGAIYGRLTEFNVHDSLFEHNTALTNGGAFCVHADTSVIEGSRLYNNTAGSSGGAFDFYGSAQMFNTEIINNNAKNGGALKYSSYKSYSHIQNNLNMFNVTVAGNKALTSGGAFSLSTTNFAITNSNIYNNVAPAGSTFSGGGSIDARSNWWGSSRGPDDSVWNKGDIQFRTWANDRINWGIVSINDGTSDDGNDGTGGKSNNGGSYSKSDVSTGSGASTGSTLSGPKSYSGNSKSYSFDGSWPSGSYGHTKGENNGFGEGYSRYGEGNSKYGGNSSYSSKTPVSGNAVNPNSMSKVNSSSVNDLSSVGLSVNAADSSPSSQSSSSDGGESGSSSVKSYEITKQIKEISEVDKIFFNLLFLIAWCLFFIGFYRKSKSNEDN